MTSIDGLQAGDHSAVVVPGWYPNPMNAAETQWWDGERWGPTSPEARDAGWWLANDGHYYPPGQPNAGQLGGSPAPPKRLLARWWFWVLVFVGVPAAAYFLMVIGILAQIGPDDYHSVYEEDFSVGAGNFDIWEEPEGSAAVIDGAYVMTNRNSGKALTVGVSPSWGSAERVRIDAQMVLTEAGDKDGFGVYLSRTDGKVYVFSVNPETGAWITGPGVECQAQSPLANVRAGEFALSGKHDWDNVTTLTGYLDGRVVVTCVDEGFDPTDNSGAFQGAGLWLYADRAPATVQVDDVTVDSYMY